MKKAELYLMLPGFEEMRKRFLGIISEMQTPAKDHEAVAHAAAIAAYDAILLQGKKTETKGTKK